VKSSNDYNFELDTQNINLIHFTQKQVSEILEELDYKRKLDFSISVFKLCEYKSGSPKWNNTGLKSAQNDFQ